METVEATKWPHPAELLPHAGVMVWLAAVEAHDESHTRCAARVDDLGPFLDRDGGVGAWVALEWMAQCIAVHASLAGRALGEPPRVGMLLGSRRVRFHVPRYAAGGRLSVVAERTWGRDSGMVAFDCFVEGADDGQRLADAGLNCFVPAPGEGLPVHL